MMLLIGKKITPFFLLIFILLAPQAAMAWGRQAHMLIANIAEKRLTPVAKKRVRDLLDLEGDRHLATVANWADESAPKNTKVWHYVNFWDGNCHYTAKENCPKGECVVMAVQEQINTLGDKKASLIARLASLKFVVHLVADIHQPLHAGMGEDRGGNEYKIRSPRGRSKSLHAFWDGDLFFLADIDEHRMLTHLKTTSFSPEDMAFDPVAIVQESCNLVRQKGFYPSHTVRMSYVHQYAPFFKRRIELAGVRLANVLNDTLGK